MRDVNVSSTIVFCVWDTMSVVFIVINPASTHCLLNGILSVSIYYVANIIIILA